MSFGGGSGSSGPKGDDPGAGRVRVAPIPTFTLNYGFTGGSEPAWPTVAGGTVTDGGLTWTANRARKLNGTVSGVYNRATFEDETMGAPTGVLQYGLLTWTSGLNEGVTIEVRAYTVAPKPTYHLMEAMPEIIQVGDTYEIAEGCPRIRGACRDRFSNLSNFRGFPDIPTEDKALATPNFTSQGEQKEDDGNSKF